MQVTRRFLRICTVNRRWLRWLAPVVAVLIITSLALATVAPTVFRTRPVAAAKVACPAVLPDAAAALLTAKLCRGSILVADLTTETDSTTANADGTETLTHNYRPVRVQRDGAWAPVDATLVVNTDGSIGPRAAAIDLRLSGGGNTNLAQLSEDGVTISLGSPVGVLPVPQLAGAMATYANVLPDVDLQVTADEDGFSEYFVVKNATAGANPALTSLAFPISVVGGALSSDTAGNITVKDVHGSALFAAAAPQMWAGDENMPPAPGNDLAPPQPPQGAAPPIKATMGVSLAGHTLRLVPNQAMLTSPLATFPVILDPTFTSTRLNWTWVDSGAPTTSHWDDSGDARVGTSDSGASVRRSFFQMDMAAVNGKHINSATFTIPEVWAWSCTPEPVEIWETYGISTATTWNAQPTFLAKNDTSTTAKGWSSAGEGGASPCPSGNVSFNVTAALRDAASKSWGHATLALKASNETSDLSWKRFGNNPTIAITYNTPPPVPNTFSMTPQSGTLDCSGGTTGFIGVNSRTPTLQAVVRSADGTAVRGDFHLWDTNTLATIIATRGAGSESAFVASGAVAKVTSPALTEGHAYSWQVEADDGTVYSTVYTSNCHFYVDTTAPAVAPTVASTTYPANTWAGSAGAAGSFALSANGVGDVASYRYGLDTNPPTTVVAGASATLSITPPTNGPHTLYVQSADGAGNLSPLASYSFDVGDAAITSPTAGTITAGLTQLTGAAPPGTTGVTFQWRRADTDTWTNILPADVTYAAGGGAVTWPVAPAGGAYPALNWNVQSTLAAANGGAALAGPLEVQAAFTGDPGGVSPQVIFTYDPNRAMAASTEIGPGSVNLVTGAMTITSADVSASAYNSDLSVERSFDTRQAGVYDATHMFGPGWVSTATVADASSPYTSLTVTGSLAQVGLPDGSTLGFIAKTATTFTPQIGAENLSLLYTAGSDSYTLSDQAGDVVIFTRITGAPAGQYTPTSVSEPGNGQTMAMSWQTVTVDGATVIRPTQLLAPVPSGVSCATLTRGCRALTFSYATTTTATGATQSAWGDYVGRVQSMSFTAWDPASAAMKTIVVAAYQYDQNGRLVAAWDPRLDNGSTHLWTTYTYDSDGIITTISPTNQPAWNLAYTTIPGDAGKGRLASVSRSALAAGTATTTVVYSVPVTGTGSPYDMSSGQTSRWGQSQAPIQATAVFDPGQIPSGNQSTGAMPSSWTRGAISYLDANARLVNTISPGGYTTASWYDQHGNVNQSLTAADLAEALNASSTDTAAQEAALAASYSTIDTYSADGTQLLSSVGPTHSIALSTGEVVAGRDLTLNTYDQGAPSGVCPCGLVTTAVTGIRWIDATGASHDADERTTATGYDWTLRMPSIVTIDPAGLNLSTRTVYDDTTGQTTSVTTPAGGATTTTPATTKTIYYRAGAGSGYTECDSHPEWANLVCRTQPGGQAASGPELPVTVTTYDLFGKPTVVIEKTSAGVLRTTSTTYDSAERVSTVAIVGAPGVGTALPIQRDSYDPASGLLTSVQSLDTSNTVIASTVTTYDSLGRVTSYTDSGGAVTTTTYDLMSRPVTITDGKGTRTISYDQNGENRGLATKVVDSQVGAITGGYDADRRLVTENWPNNIVVTHSYSETGAPVGITYTKTGCGQSNCILYSQTESPGASGQIATSASTLSGQIYTYDTDGRLTRVNDTVGGQCVTRAYGFNAATDRTNLTSYTPAADGSCQTTANASAQSWTYDSADRLATSGYSYDSLGRASSVPAADTQNPAGGNLTATYDVNDLVASLSQGGQSESYTLDVDNQRIRSFVDSAAISHTNHYSGTGDVPAWTDEGGSVWTRLIAGLSGGLVATTTSGSTSNIAWQLADLQGNIVATINNADIGLDATSEATEYGVMRNSAQAGTQRYGWLGGSERASDNPAGIMLMGLRLYDPSIGRFLSVDSVAGGSCNAYEYVCADPVSSQDTTGQMKRHWHWWGWEELYTRSETRWIGHCFFEYPLAVLAVLSFFGGGVKVLGAALATNPWGWVALGVILYMITIGAVAFFANEDDRCLKLTFSYVNPAFGFPSSYRKGCR